MKVSSREKRPAYTVIELMVTIVVVAVLSSTVGVFFVKLLNIQEKDREEAYIRGRLADVCGAYADYLSIGSSVNTNLERNVIAYRQEAGGVSLETGLVSHVAFLSAPATRTNKVVKLSVDVFKQTDDGIGLSPQDLRSLNAAPFLVPLSGDAIDSLTCTFTQLDMAALVRLRATAEYHVKNDDGVWERKAVSVERLARLWNRE